MLHRLIGEDIDLVWQPAAHLWPVKEEFIVMLHGGEFYSIFLPAVFSILSIIQSARNLRAAVPVSFRIR